MPNMQPTRIKTISEYHKIMGLPKPEHPLVSVINFESITNLPHDKPVSLIFDFYSISLKRNFNGKMKYGQQQYDFDEGIMFFISPGQVFGIEVGNGETLKHSGWLLLIHPDFLWNSQLAKTIKLYEYFDYSVHEALFLSDKEETTIIQLMQNRTRYLIPLTTLPHGGQKIWMAHHKNWAMSLQYDLTTYMLPHKNWWKLFPIKK